MRTALRVCFAFAVAVAISVIFLVACSGPRAEGWGGTIKTSGSSPYLPNWFRSLVRIDGFPCCGDADGVYADDWRSDGEGYILATVTGGGLRNHPWAPIGRTYRIPNAMVVFNKGNPTGHAWLFLNPASLEPLCFVHGGGV